MEIKLKHFYPLILFIVPTIIISIILFVDDPPTPTILVGFIILMVAACGTYYLGIRGVLKETK